MTCLSGGNKSIKMVFTYLKEFYRETTLGGFGQIGKRLPLVDK